jgi:hypothetical protein
MFQTGSSCLFLDASGLTTRVGIWREGRWLAYRESGGGALEAIYTGVSAALKDAQTPWERLAGYIYVEGPGSVLGLRLTAMAIRTWQVDDGRRTGGHARPVWAYGGLQLAAALALAGRAGTPFAVFTDARQGHWNLLKVIGNDPAGLNANNVLEVGENELPEGSLYYVPARKVQGRVPPHAQPLPFSLQNHPGILSQPGLCRAIETATPVGSTPVYKKWIGAEK